MKRVLILGAGKIGETIAALFSLTNDYEILLCDFKLASAQKSAAGWKNVSALQLDCNNEDACLKTFQGYQAVISALPYHCNIPVAKAAAAANIHYFDLTEDVKTTAAIKEIAGSAKSLFAPQCGLAPGFIGTSAASLIREFDSVKSLKMRVGALPLYPSNMLKYNLTWSTEGLINEYCNECDAIRDGKKIKVQPLEGYEKINLNGEELEAFNTSGGIGSICALLEGRVENLDYKTLRYNGHRDLVYFLLYELGFINKRAQLKEILEENIPRTLEDKCHIFIEATGLKENNLFQKTFVKTIYSKEINGKVFGAIQISTASGVCGVVDLVLNGKIKKSEGFLGNEEVGLEEFLASHLGGYYC